MNKKRSRDPSWLSRFSNRDIVTHHNHLNLKALFFGAFGSKTEVQAVSGVILHHQQTSSGARYRPNRGQDRFHRG